MLSGLKLLVRLSLTVSNIFRYKPIILENYRPIHPSITGFVSKIEIFIVKKKILCWNKKNNASCKCLKNKTVFILSLETNFFQKCAKKKYTGNFSFALTLFKLFTSFLYVKGANLFQKYAPVSPGYQFLKGLDSNFT